MKLIAAGLTDPGRIRKNNEDSYWVDQDLGLMIVADGMGGHAAGEVASQIAVEVVREQVKLTQKTGRIPSVGKKPEQLSNNAYLLSASVNMANEMIFSAAQKNLEKKGMGTTLVAVLVNKDLFSVAHVGDSRLYLYRNNALHQVTRDHSLVEENVSRGLMTREEAEQSDIKNVLTRALGIGEEVDIDIQDYAFQKDDVFMLCTDGLCKMVADAEVEKALKNLSNPTEMCHNLIGLANERGGRDNVTVVCGVVSESGIMERISSAFKRRKTKKKNK